MTALVPCIRQLALRSASHKALRACAVAKWPTVQACRRLHDANLKRGPAAPPTRTPALRQTGLPVYEKVTFADRFLDIDDKPKTNEKPTCTKRRTPRALLRAAVKRYSEKHPPPMILVRPAEKFPSEAETRRSYRKHVNSVRTQSLHDIKRTVDGEAEYHWRDTYALLAKHTADSREVLRFRVKIGRAAATQARSRLLTGLDSNVWQISRRYQSLIHVEEAAEDGVLALSLSGSVTAVRQSLLELLRVVGQVTALRVHNSELRAALAKDWEKKDATTTRVKLLDARDVATEDMTLTLGDEAEGAPLPFREGSEGITTTALNSTPTTPTTIHKKYKLDRSADKIAPPALWTKHSFNEYIAAVTHGEVPLEKHDQFYGNGPQHQEVVAALLVRAFTSADTRPAISLSAVKLALTYLQKRGTGLRRANEHILAQIDLQDLPADTETFTILLIGAARAGDLRSYTNVLKTMIRKGFRPQATAWLAFLEMTRNRNHKNRILAGMKKRGLDRIPAIDIEMARCTALLKLEWQLSEQARASQEEEVESYHIGAFVQEQDQQYGQNWLDTMTLNKILEILGRSLEFEACKHLLAIVQKEQRVKPDAVTLNTMITHIRDISEWISVMDGLLVQYPGLMPDKITYDKLFSIAWSLNKPNMMAVIWRYATLARLASSKMKSRLNSLLWRNPSALDSSALRQRRIWSPAIFGNNELQDVAALSVPAGNPASFYDVFAKFREANKNKMPAIGLARKLREAYDNDHALNKLRKEKPEVTAEDMMALSVEIPMKEATRRRKG